MKKVLLVGGGSGGHIKPLLPIAKKLLRDDPSLKLYFVCDRANLDLAKTIFGELAVDIRPITSGKFRRYHHLSWWQHLAPSILLPNIIDFFKVGFSHIQAIWLVTTIKPNLIFAKGGYPCLPFGLASKLLSVKLIIHDSDAVAGLTNRVLAKYAVKIATGMPKKYYNYSQQKTVFTGIPIDSKIKPVSDKERRSLKKKLNLDDKMTILLTGGGLGATMINDLAPELAKKYPDYQFVLASGKRDYDRVVKQKLPKNLAVFDFIVNFSDYLMASDLIISRAGATTIAALATAHKPTILLPSPKLTGGHQLKNAQILADAKAALVFDETKIEQDRGRGLAELFELFDQAIDKRRALADKIGEFSHSQADLRICQLIEQEMDDEA